MFAGVWPFAGIWASTRFRPCDWCPPSALFQVVPLGEGSVIVKVHDLCLDLPPLTLDVQLVGLARLHLHTLTKVSGCIPS